MAKPEKNKEECPQSPLKQTGCMTMLLGMAGMSLLGQLAEGTGSTGAGVLGDVLGLVFFAGIAMFFVGWYRNSRLKREYLKGKK